MQGSSDIDTQALLKAQAEFLQAWAKHGQNLNQSIDQTPLVEQIEKVKAALHGRAPREFQEFLHILYDQWQVFHHSGQALINELAKADGDHTSALNAFQNAMNEHIQQSVAQQWQLTPAFNSFFSHLSTELSALLANKDHSVSQHINNLFSHMDSLNPLANANNHQMSLEQLQEGASLFNNYQLTLNQYIEQFSLINQKAMDQLSTQVKESESKINSLDTLRLMWVECYEASYAETVFTTEYQTTHSSLSNDLLKLQRFMQNQWDEQLSRLSIASMDVVDQLGKNQHQLRKEVKSLKRQLAAQQQAHQTQLDEQMASLRKELGLPAQGNS